MSDEPKVPQIVLDAFAEAQQDALKKIAGELEEVKRLRPIVRDLAAKAPDFYEEWLESIKGPGRWCPLCRCITKEGAGHSMQNPMPIEHHGDWCPYRRAVEITR